MYRFIITEKYSVAQAVGKALGVTTRKDGYLEGKDILIGWCAGHLVALAQPEAYDAGYAKWCKEHLPILPENWKYTVCEGREKQLAVLRGLLHREDVTEVINACDAGREGELIFRLVYRHCGCTKPVKRLWISSMEEAAIREGFKRLRPGEEYDGLYQAALCRAQADWLVGINATRYFSLLYGKTLNIGRVMSPTLALLVQREAEISAFQPKPFYTVELDCGFSAVTERLDSKAEAESIAAACQGTTAVVKAVERTERTENAPALYDLTTLQRDANRILGYTAQQTLDYLQALYEKKLCTYPRTDSRYLTEDMESGVPELVSIAAALCSLPPLEVVSAGQVCNNKKVSDHHAIVPTKSAACTDPAALPAGEREILRLASMGLLRAVSLPHRYAETVVTVECGGQMFTAKGRTVLESGWKSLSQESKEKETCLPELLEGQQLPVTGVNVKEGKTTPAKRFTEDTILSAMEHPVADGFPADAERRGLGTPATRAAILEKLLTTGFIERKTAKKRTSLIPTATGAALITVLPEQLQSPELTAEWEYLLGQVERGELSPDSFMQGIAAMLNDLMQTYTLVPGAEVLFPSGRESVGKCPRCGADVTESAKGFFCENRACSFALWKDNKFFTAKRKQLTKAVAAALLKDGCVPLKGCYSEKTGKTYDAVAVLEDTGGKYINFSLEFPTREAAR